MNGYTERWGRETGAGGAMCDSADRSIFTRVGHVVYFFRQGMRWTTVGGAVFLPGISRLIGARTSPGRPRSRAKFFGTGWEIGKIVGDVVDGTEVIIMIFHVPGGVRAPARGSVTSEVATTGGKGGRKGRSVVPGTSE